jgi:hypothetical protein
MIAHADTCTVDSQRPADPGDIAHLTDRLSGAVVRTEPFPYAVIDGFLPEDLFRILRDHARDTATDGWQGDHIRQSWFLTRGIGDPEGACEVTRRAAAAFSSAALVEATRTLFAGHFEQSMGLNSGWTGATVQTDELVVGLELMQDRPGFMLLPHSDSSRRLTGCLVYLADDDDPDTLGTRLYAPIDGDLRDINGNGVWYDKVREVAAAPYRANTALIWARSDRSFHGVPMGLVDRERRALQWCIEKSN